MPHLDGVVGTVGRERGSRGEAEGVASRPYLRQAEARHRAGAEEGGVLLLQIFAAPKPAFVSKNPLCLAVSWAGGDVQGLVLRRMRTAQAENCT